MLVSSWADVWRESLQGLWFGLVGAQGEPGFLPKLLLAIVVFLIGWLIAAMIEKAIAHVIRSIKLDKLLSSAGVEKVLSKAGFKLDSGLFIGALVKWFLIIVFLVASLDILGLSEVTQFLREVVLTYLPNVIVAVLVLVIGAIIAEFLEKVIAGSAKAAEVKSWNFLGSVAKWAVWVFAIIIALAQLGIAPQFLQILFTGFVAMLALAAGLAFGIGGKDHASKALDKLREGIKHK